MTENADTPQDTSADAAPVRVPNVSVGARSGLDHEVIGANAQAAYDENQRLAESDSDDGDGDPDGDADTPQGTDETGVDPDATNPAQDPSTTTEGDADTPDVNSGQGDTDGQVEDGPAASDDDGPAGYGD